jgi:short-subunit dehydrogenase
MNVLVLGATSAIGSNIAAAFAPNNRVRLVGRDIARLRAAGDLCLANGAVAVDYSQCDLASSGNSLPDELGAWPVDVLINAASSSSQTRDSGIAADRMREIAEVDLLAPLDLIRGLSARQSGRPLRVVFVSSVLALVSSPDRAIYGLFKSLHESCLRRLQSALPGVDVLVVRVGKVLPVDRTTPDTLKLASAVRAAFDKRKQTLFFGMSGRVLAAAYYLQPLFFAAMMGLRRRLQLHHGKEQSRPASGSAEDHSHPVPSSGTP